MSSDSPIFASTRAPSGTRSLPAAAFLLAAVFSISRMRVPGHRCGGCPGTGSGWPPATPPGQARPVRRGSSWHARQSPRPPGTGRRSRWHWPRPVPGQTRPRRPGFSSSGTSARYIARASMNTVDPHVMPTLDVGDELVQQISLSRECALGPEIPEVMVRIADRQLRLEDRLLGHRQPVNSSIRHDRTPVTSCGAGSAARPVYRSTQIGSRGQYFSTAPGP